jgi:polyphenol oxidase
MQTVELSGELLLAYTSKEDGNVDDRFSDKSLVKQNRKAIYKKLGINSFSIIEAQQIHQDRILPLNEDNTKMWRGNVVTGIDGFITDQKDSPLIIRVADCAPVVFYEPDHHILGLFHVGWQGATLDIHTKGLQLMQTIYKVDPKKVLCWIGPCAARCCYRVDTEPEQRNSEAWKGFIRKSKNEWIVDIPGYLEASLREVGILKKNLILDNTCTVESSNLFSQKRANVSDERNGRFAVIAMLK